MSKQDNKINVVNVRLVDAPALYSDRAIMTEEDAVKVVADELKQYDREVVAILNLNMKKQVINFNICSIGTLDSIIVNPRDVMKSAVLSNAHTFIGIHNHPSGNWLPSIEDIITAKRLMQCGQILNIPMLDHIIVGGESGDIFSFRSAEMMKETVLDNILQSEKPKGPVMYKPIYFNLDDIDDYEEEPEL